jgi:ribosome maturation factor RimP
MGIDLQKVRVLAESVFSPLGYELVDLEFVTEHGLPTLRLFVDKEGGITVGDCQRMSREVDTLLEVEEAVLGRGGRYHLEVSSPGLNRPLVKEADFAKYVGKVASVRTSVPVPEYGDRRNYKGVIQKVENKAVEMLIDGKEYQVPLELIEKARLEY